MMSNPPGTAEPRCEKTDLLASQCAHCRPRPPLDVSAFGPWITASFDGECAGDCGRPLRAGDSIRSDGEGGWLCVHCGTP
jgi:hypothetical protein